MNITWITRSLQVKLIGMLAIMLALLGVTVALNFNTFSSLDGSAPALNQSGAQRMRVFKLAAEASTIERSVGAERVEAAADARKTIAQFDAVQAGLRSGDSALGLTGTSNAGIISQLDTVNALWAGYRDDLETVLASNSVGREALTRLGANADPLFTDANNLVKGLVASGASQSAVDNAGAQRMRAYKMAFIAGAFLEAEGARRTEVGRRRAGDV